MYHFFVPQGPDPEGIIRMTGSDVNHLRNVLRRRPGDRVVISDGTDRDYYCVIREIRPDEILFAVDGEAAESELPARLVLYQGLPKGDKMELIIQKAVELGASRIVAVSMKRSVVKLDPRKQEAKRSRWNRIAESAAKQSGRGMIPQVDGVMTYPEALREAAEMDLVLVPYENAQGMRGTREALSLLAPGQTAAIFIGPEGGFDPEEIEAAKGIGARTISLGRRILRTETAGLAALTLCMVRLENAYEEMVSGKQE